MEDRYCDYGACPYGGTSSDCEFHCGTKKEGTGLSEERAAWARLSGYLMDIMVETADELRRMREEDGATDVQCALYIERLSDAIERGIDKM